jgi:hypothetical protein
MPAATHASVTGDSEGSWVKYENDYFEAYSDIPSSEALRLLEDLEIFRTAMVSFDGSRVPEGSAKTRVIIFASKDDFRTATGHSLVDAFTLGIEGAPHIVMSGEGKPGWSSTTLRHEFVHVLQGYAGGELPWWFFEGYAECMSAMEFREKNREFVVGRSTIRSRSKRSFVPWTDLIAEDFSIANVASAEQGSSAYFQAGLLVRYLLVGDEQSQSSRLVEYLERVQGGESSAKAFAAVFGEPADELAGRVYRQRKRSIKPRIYSFLPGIEQRAFELTTASDSAVQEILDELKAEAGPAPTSGGDQSD